MSGAGVLAYAVVAYAAFLATVLWAIGFVGNFAGLTSIDIGPADPLGAALAIDTGLLMLFGLQHSVRARKGFKAWLVGLAPRPAERSTYVLASSLVLAAVLWQWRPIGGAIWQVEAPEAVALITGLFWAGWGLVLVSTFLIDHFDLFGLRQAWLHYRGRQYTPSPFQMPGIYRFVRHPTMTGFMIAFWATPTMTAGHLLFATVTTLYIEVAVRFEERDLVASHGASYEEYRARTGRFLPRIGRVLPHPPAVPLPH